MCSSDLSFYKFQRYFGHFLGFGGIFGNFMVSKVFRSFLRFRGYFGHFFRFRKHFLGF